MKENLLNHFAEARAEKYDVVIVVIEAEGTREFIIVPSYSFDAKEAFYKGAYNDEGVHVMNSKVEIVGVSACNYDEIGIIINSFEGVLG